MGTPSPPSGRYKRRETSVRNVRICRVDGGHAFLVLPHWGTLSLVIETLAIPGSTDLLELTFADVPGHIQKVSRVTTQGRVVWANEPPLGPNNDSWTEARVKDDQLLAFSWSCYRLRYDLVTGRELDRVFTK